MDFKNIIKSNGRKFDRLRPVRSLLDGDSRVKKPYFSIFFINKRPDFAYKKTNSVPQMKLCSRSFTRLRKKKKHLTASSIPFITITYSRVFG